MKSNNKIYTCITDLFRLIEFLTSVELVITGNVTIESIHIIFRVSSYFICIYTNFFILRIISLRKFNILFSFRLFSMFLR